MGHYHSITRKLNVKTKAGKIFPWLIFLLTISCALSIKSKINDKISKGQYYDAIIMLCDIKNEDQKINPEYINKIESDIESFYLDQVKNNSNYIYWDDDNARKKVWTENSSLPLWR